VLKLYTFVQDKWTSLKKFFTRKEEGASLVEYALLVALIAVACILAITALGGSIRGLFQGLSTTLSGVNTNPS
jgi:pilus assembly protein Flp/PilA